MPKPYTYKPRPPRGLPGLAARLAQARTQAGHTQESLAAVVGLHRETLWQYEHEVTAEPRLVSLVKIATACGVTTDWLLGLAPPPSPHDAAHWRRTLLQLQTVLTRQAADIPPRLLTALTAIITDALEEGAR